MLNFSNYIVLGFGKTGISCVNFLLRKNKKVLLLDNRETPPNLDKLPSHENFSYMFGKFEKKYFEHAECIIISPGLSRCSKELEVLPNNVPVISDIELFRSYVKEPLIAITGTNGKSTVTTLLGMIAKEAGIKASIGGNIGIPALDLVDKGYDLYILELSSFQLENTYMLKPTIATILNIATDHMDRYKNLAEYVSAKQRIWHNAEICVQNTDYARHGPFNPKKSVWITNSEPKEDQFGIVKSDGETWIQKGSKKIISTKSIKILGEHNTTNVMAAIAIADSYGISHKTIKRAIQKFTGLKHRCEVVTNYNNILWINDSKGSNVAATLASLTGIGKSIPGKWVLILGGKAKEHDFSDLIHPIQQYCKMVIIFGEAKKLIYQQMRSNAICEEVNDLNEAIVAAKRIAAIGDGVLFSPACASFDMFNNFEHRGNSFAEIVRGYINS